MKIYNVPSIKLDTETDTIIHTYFETNTKIVKDNDTENDIEK